MENSDVFIENLYKETYPALCHYIHRMIPQYALAEDIVQETFFEAYRKRQILIEHKSPIGWLYLTAKHKMMKLNQKQKRYVTMDEVEEDRAEEDSNYNKVDLENSLQKTLTKEEIGIYHKFYEYGYSSKEMAGKLGISESCFKIRMFRMREKIRSSL